jgi:2-keto-4-pentenoate hydratase
MVLACDTVSLDGLLRPRVAAKLAFRLGDSLDDPDLDETDLLAATSELLPTLEVIDSRYVAVAVGAADRLADNCGAALMLLGPPAQRHTPAAQVGEQALASVVRLARQIVDERGELGAGLLLLSSPVAEPTELHDASHLRTRWEGLESVWFHADAQHSKEVPR